MIVSFERDIKNVLVEEEKAITELLKTNFDQGTKNISSVFPDVLGQISEVLFDASKTFTKWHRHIKDDSKLHFSFFPGYISNDRTRIFNTTDLAEVDKNDKLIRSIQKYENSVFTDDSKISQKINLDYWHNNLSNNMKITSVSDISFLSLAYHFLFLGKSIEQEVEEEDFVQNLLTEYTKKGIKISKEEIEVPDFDKVVGGTHQWASKVSDEIALNDSLDPLELLAFFDDIKDSRDCQILYKTWVNIPFDIFPQELSLKELKKLKLVKPQKKELKENELNQLKQSVEYQKYSLQKGIFNWCNNVVDKLDYPSNTKSKVDVSVKWPYNPNCRLDSTNINGNDKRLILIYRAYIVGFWLQFVFHPEFVNNYITATQNPKDNTQSIALFEAWFSFFDFYKLKCKSSSSDHHIDIDVDLFKYRLERIEILKELLIEKDFSGQFQNQNYKFWYVIPFKHRLNFTNNSDIKKVGSLDENGVSDRINTGSAMILSNYLLDKEYFRFIIPWLERMYDAMREYDTSKQATKKIKSEIMREIESIENIADKDKIIAELKKIREKFQDNNNLDNPVG